MTEKDDELSNFIVCPKCKKTVRAARAGTITQWITGCDCELSTPSDEEVEVELCYDCGKRTNTGRAGSLTQWIFRADCCSCASTASKPSIAQRVLAERAAELTTAEQTDRLEQSRTADQETIRDLATAEFIKNTRYEPISRLGSGASGSVFLCRDTLLNRKVALKKLRKTSALTVIDFQAEGQTCSKLKHPNIVSILDLSTDDRGVPYMVMEYVDGITLENYLVSHGPLTTARALELMDEICDALDYSHSLGILHRDIKTSNILLDNQRAYLIDFGIAKFKGILTDGGIDFGTPDNTIAGSPLYMPPDQGRGFRYDQRSEVYSVGCVLFQALVGKTPYSGNSSLEILSQHAHKPVPSLSEAAPNKQFPQELEEIVAKCLAKHPDDRYQSLDDLRKALAQIDSSQGMPDVEPAEKRASFGDVNLAHISNVVVPSASGTPSPWTQRRFSMLAVVTILVTVAGGMASRLFHQEKQLSGTVQNRSLNRKPVPDFNDVDRRDAIRKAIKRKETRLRFSSGFIDDSDLELLKGYDRIEELDLMGNPITDRGLMQVSAPYAKKLVLTNCDVRTLDFLPNFPNLQALYLEGTNITDDSLNNLKYLPMLRELKLSETTIGDSGLRKVPVARSLEYVIVHGTRVTREAAEAVSKQMPFTAIAPTQRRRIFKMLVQLDKLEADKRYSDALEQATKIIDVLVKAQGEDAPLTVPYLLRRSEFKLHLNRKDALDDTKLAIGVARSSKNDVMLKTALAALLRAYEANGFENEARETRSQLVATIKRLDGPDSPEILQYRTSLPSETKR